MPSPVDDLTTHLVLLGARTGLRDDRVRGLLGRWASSSPWAHHHFLGSARVIHPSMHKPYHRSITHPEEKADNADGDNVSAVSVST